MREPEVGDILQFTDEDGNYGPYLVSSVFQKDIYNPVVLQTMTCFLAYHLDDGYEDEYVYSQLNLHKWRLLA